MVLYLPRYADLWAQLKSLLQSLQARDRSPGLDQLRWRLHLRLLLVAAALSAAFGLSAALQQRFDAAAWGLPITLGAWFFLRAYPGYNRGVARSLVTAFVSLAVYSIFVEQHGAAQRALMALSVMSVFGALLDGLISGALAALAGSFCAAILLATHGTSDPLFLISAFAIPATWCLFATSLSFSWVYGALVARQQQGAEDLRQATSATEALARTLSDEVIQANARLQQSLASGLDGLTQASELRQILQDARGQLPAEVPREGVDPDALLESLRAILHRFFLWVAFGVSVTAGLVLLFFRFPLWELGFMVAVLTAMLLGLGDGGSAGWRKRLHLFLLAALGALAVDVQLSQAQPPAASLVFLPLLAFYAGMLGAPWVAGLVTAAGLGILLGAGQVLQPLPGQSELLAVLGLLTLTLMGVSLSTVPLYRKLLRELRQQEDRLHQSLSAYRRLVSTLFHDLANPLAVLQGLAALPPNLHGPDDLPRAQRMVARLRSVTDSARGAANRRAGQVPVSVQDLAHGLGDLFAEALERRSLQWMLSVPPGLRVRQGGALLDTILAKLMSNAVRYAPEGSVLRFKAGEGEGGVWMRLADSGPGFDEQALQSLAQGQAPRPEPGAGGELGSGFSLVLAQSDALDLGGRLTLSNPASGGAQAELWLPD